MRASDVRRLVPRAGTVAWLAIAAAGSGAIALLGRRGWWASHRGARRIADVMIREVLTVDASATLMEAAQKMREGNVGVLPVVSDTGVLCGLITDRDLVVRAMADGADPAATKVSECATRDLVCARPESPIDEALEVMRECHIGRLPVVDYGNRVIGIVTLSSLALRSADEDDALHTAQEVSRRSARVA